MPMTPVRPPRVACASLYPVGPRHTPPRVCLAPAPHLCVPSARLHLEPSSLLPRALAAQASCSTSPPLASSSAAAIASPRRPSRAPPTASSLPSHALTKFLARQPLTRSDPVRSQKEAKPAPPPQAQLRPDRPVLPSKALLASAESLRCPSAPPTRLFLLDRVPNRFGV
ncbi:hypothetical protein D1007_48740 [Hordeum vulgare]|uniref:proline-rich receptor-like protein kinase PERK2 n=1 Tax=Hordeum vulgare subsp. vulgare TaxID=112509 RepID=UPI00162D3798|nr:proline-rich receptor-like protein kinase PERK2 [Hordeum vulgare subsp. vulgare]KAE8778360.1 hypothetical protein D1007_48740 [Hordeum vulgare]KAI4977607.1 hypothetical protein ZWY2020_005703 [Hordeum vulgare]